MMAAQLKETTMDPRKRTLLRVEIADGAEVTRSTVDALMGTKPEARFRFIQENAEFADEETLDI
jgi:topoisomerase-4 subunit B